MNKADYKYYVDWSNSGLFNHANSDISAYVLSSSWRSGRPSDVEYDAAGVLSLKLDNSTSIFSSFNTASPLSGLLTTPELKVKITMKIGAGAEVIQAIGYLDSILPSVGDRVDVSTADLTAHGVIGQFNKGEADVALQENITTGAAVDLLLDADSFPSADAAIDSGLTTISKWWSRKGVNRLQTLRELQDAELGRMREGKSTPFVFEGRGHIFNSPHATAQATYGAGTLKIWNLRQRDPSAGVYNLVRGSVRTFNKSEDVVLAVLVDVANGLGGAPIPIAAGETKVIWIEFPNASAPADYIAVDDWGTVDYEVNTENDGTGTDITNATPSSGGVTAARVEYGQKLKLTFVNESGQAGYFIVLRAHGVAIVEGDPIPVQAGTGKSEYPYPNPWATNLANEQARCNYVLARYQVSRPGLTFDVKANYDAAHLAEAQAREIGDRIRVVASVEDFGLGIDAEFIIDSIQHAVDEARLHVMTVSCSKAPATQLAASAAAYTPRVVGDFGAPDDLYVNAIASGLDILFGVQARKYNALIVGAEFRAKFYTGSMPESVDLRTPDEGGTLVHNGTTELVITGLGANYLGCQYLFTSPAQGRWYFAWKLKGDNSLRPVGRSTRSVWSDGNLWPEYVRNWVETEDPALADSGPPSGWVPAPVQAGPIAGTVVASAPRPPVNGKKILSVIFQIKDATTGSWRSLDADAGAAEVLYDGSGVDHIYDKVNGTISKASGGYGTAGPGDLILFDVRDSSAGGWSWNVHHCQAGAGVTISGSVLSGAFGFRPAFAPTAGVYPGIRIMIVKPYWAWNTEGYLGDEANHGLCAKEFWSGGQRGDTTTTLFVSDPIQIPSGLDAADVQVRVIFGNIYSASDDDAYSSAPPSDPGQAGGCVSLPIVGGHVSTDGALGSVFYIEADESFELDCPTNLKRGDPIAWIIKQTAGGNHTITLGAGIGLGTDLDEVVLSTEENAIDYIGGMFFAENTSPMQTAGFHMLSCVKGYA